MRIDWSSMDGELKARGTIVQMRVKDYSVDLISVGIIIRADKTRQTYTPPTYKRSQLFLKALNSEKINL
jgi:hypothetical protein